MLCATLTSPRPGVVAASGYSFSFHAPYDETTDAMKKSFIASIVLACALSACGGMMPDHDAGNDSGTNPTDSGSNPTDAGSSMGDGSSSCLPMGNAAMGQSLASSFCGSCHGVDLGGGTAPPGSNLHNDGMGAGSWSDCDFQRALRMGVTPAGRTLCALMPRYDARTLSDQQIADILAHLKTLTTAGRTTEMCR